MWQGIKNIKTSFCFFDETGLLRSARDPFFAVGMIKCVDPYKLYSKIKNIRDKYHFYDEMKWSWIYYKNAPFINEFINIFYNELGASFSCTVFRKNELDLQKYFSSDLWIAYESFTVMELEGNIDKNEIVAVLADDLSTPANLEFEKHVRDIINKKFGRLTVHGICRVYSKGVELVQLADVILGAIIYDFKLKDNLILNPSKAKRKVLNHLKRISEIPEFSKGIRNKKFNVWVIKPKSVKDTKSGP